MINYADIVGLADHPLNSGLLFCDPCNEVDIFLRMYVRSTFENHAGC